MVNTDTIKTVDTMKDHIITEKDRDMRKRYKEREVPTIRIEERQSVLENTIGNRLENTTGNRLESTIDLQIVQ